MIEIISYLTVALFCVIVGMSLERRLGYRKEILSICRDQNQAIKDAKIQMKIWREKATAVDRDLSFIYSKIPMLPVTPQTMEAATDALTQFCITFHDQIDLANHGPKPRTLEFRNVNGTVKLVRVATGEEWQPGPA